MGGVVVLEFFSYLPVSGSTKLRAPAHRFTATLRKLERCSNLSIGCELARGTRCSDWEWGQGAPVLATFGY